MKVYKEYADIFICKSCAKKSSFKVIPIFILIYKNMKVMAKSVSYGFSYLTVCFRAPQANANYKLLNISVCGAKHNGRFNHADIL